MSKWLLGKKVYLLGIGYYGSTSRLGHMGAWLAGKAAKQVIARDQETLHNFQQITKNVSLDTDIAWHLPEVNSRFYESGLTTLEKTIHINRKTLIITLRRFKTTQKNEYTQLIEQFLSQHADRDIVVMLMEPESVDPQNYQRIVAWRDAYPNVQIIDFSFNPVVLYLFFQKYSHDLAFIGPQFHAIITAYLTRVPYLPIAYDNKVVELLKQIGTAPAIPIQSLRQSDLQTFAAAFYEDKAA